MSLKPFHGKGTVGLPPLPIKGFACLESKGTPRSNAEASACFVGLQLRFRLDLDMIIIIMLVGDFGIGGGGVETASIGTQGTRGIGLVSQIGDMAQDVCRHLVD